MKGALAAGGVWFRLMPVAAVAASSSGPPTLDPNDLGITQDSQLTLRQLQRIALVLHPGRQQRVIDGLDNRECRGLDVLSRSVLLSFSCFVLLWWCGDVVCVLLCHCIC